MPVTMLIRKAVPDDLGAITKIYNQAVLGTTATFDTEPKTIEQMSEWFAKHGDNHPVIVSEAEGIITGWASLSRWSDRCAYDSTAELSLYIDEAYRGKGTGKKLMSAIVEAGRSANLHTLVSRIAEGNSVSLHLHEQLGFTHVGVMKEVGKKFGRLLDVFIMQKIYGPAGDWSSVK